QGMRIAIGDLDVEAARATAAELGSPERVVALPLDVTERDSFAAFLDGAEERLGPLDVLVNNAGIMQVGRFIDEDDLTARRMIDINLHGVILGMKLALARMIPRDRGHIVDIYVMPFVVNTELGSGLGEARGMSNLEPTDVADAIVEALRMGIVDVWVPKSAKRTNVLG